MKSSLAYIFVVLSIVHQLSECVVHRIATRRKFSKPSAGDVHFDMYWKSEANISVGTNAQSLQVYIDPWYATHLNVVGSTANLTFKNSYEYATQRFNSSASTTYFDEAASFSDSYGNGHLGNDILSLSSPLGNVTLGVYDVYRYAFNFVSPALSGILGLSVRDSKHNILQQLAPQLDKPIISIYRQLNDSVDGSGEITLGDLDSTNCQSNWIWADQSDTHYNGPVGNQYDVQLNSVSGTVNGTLAHSNICYVSVSAHQRFGFVALPARFMENHCVAFNVQSRQVGFAGSNTPITEIEGVHDEIYYYDDE
ncbi:eukaryotic aspartyl protease domain-containing protein [Ditylenchus destructor]|uniref:Eukaryotic aspartyl protease domain-containing protein n=1 Tax=Ditylenchus destructor TaxID=166010 RepID=A0AAD4NDZ7_9BILA|nr:eukaryotic aspartyl protease domain-containing protein [Ditylenchus destructor]